MEWHEAVEAVEPYIVGIITPQGSGTGFIFSHSQNGSAYGVATAAHVVSYAHDWEMPIRVVHYSSGEQIMLRADSRAVFIDASQDSAALVFNKGELPFPEDPPSLIDEDKSIKVGVEIGWVGFPAVSAGQLCFFSGRISARQPANPGYLIDGVAINGVSGGPVMWLGVDEFKYIGVVSAYIPNRATGESLPGLAVANDVNQFQELVKTFHSVDEAQANQTPPSPAPSQEEPDGS